MPWFVVVLFGPSRRLGNAAPWRLSPALQSQEERKEAARYLKEIHQGRADNARFNRHQIHLRMSRKSKRGGGGNIGFTKNLVGQATWGPRGGMVTAPRKNVFGAKGNRLSIKRSERGEL